MPLWSDYAMQGDWDLVANTLEGASLTIINFELVRTKHGLAHIATCTIVHESVKDKKVHRVLMGGEVVKKQIDDYLENVEGKEDPYPVTVVVVLNQRANEPDYWTLAAPPGETD